MTATEEGGALTAFVVVLAFALFVLAGLVVDGGRAITVRTSAEGEAAQAARAGAAQLSVEAVRDGTISLAPGPAAQAAQRYLDAVGRSGAVTVTGTTVGVTVRVVEPTVILGVVGIDDLSFSVHATATDVHGVAGGD